MLPVKAGMAPGASRFCPGVRRSFFCRIKCKSPIEAEPTVTIKEETESAAKMCKKQSSEKKYCVIQFTDTAYEWMPPLFALDDYHSCLLPPDGVYCVLQLDLYGNAEDDRLITIIREYSEPTSTHFNHTNLDRGVCVTKTCRKHLGNGTSGGLEQVLEVCLNESISNTYGLQAKLSRLYYCNKHGEDLPIDSSDWIVLGIFGLVLLVNVIGSLYDYILNRTRIGDKIKQEHMNTRQEHEEKKESQGNPYILCFSIFRNWKWLWHKSKDPKLDWLQGLHGVRSIATFLMISAHILIIYGAYIDNPHDFEKSYFTPYFQMIVNGAVIIQLFFVMTGLLLTFKMQIAAEKTGLTWTMVPKILLLRWLRLTPSIGLMLAFATTWLRHAGSGPLWRLFVTETVAADCRKVWWHHLLYFNNYNMGGQGKFCAAQTWYVAADMQLFVLGVLVLLLTRSGGRAIVLALLAVAGVAAPAAHVFFEGLYGVAVLTPEIYRTLTGATFHHLHMLGHNNLSAFVVGMGCAVFLHSAQKSGNHFSKRRKLLNRKLLRCLTILAIPLGFLLIYLAGVLFLVDYTPPLGLRMAYQGLYRLIFSLIAASVGLALKFDRGGLFRRVIEWDGWIVPSRLCYSVFLLHMFFIYYLTGNKTQLGHISFYNLLITHVAVAALSFAAALPFCLAIEAPMIALIAHWKRSTGQDEGHAEDTEEHVQTPGGGSTQSTPEITLKVQGHQEDVPKVNTKEDAR